MIMVPIIQKQWGHLQLDSLKSVGEIPLRLQKAFKKFLDGSFSKEKYAIKIVEKAMKGSDRFIKEGKILEGM